MKTFSVLTVSRRMGWIETAVGSVCRQTVQPNKWVIVLERNTANERNRDLLNDMYIDYMKLIDSPVAVLPSNLNTSLNEGLRHIDAEYVIFYQDFIDLPEDCFEKLLALADKKTFVTTCTPNYDGSNDGRYTGVGKPRPCEPKEWEANVAIAPMAVIRDLGGFDEEYDNGWSWDNVNLAERAAMLGCKFIIDESNRPMLLPHDKQEGLTPNGDFHAQNMERIRKGEKPLRLNYL